MLSLGIGKPKTGRGAEAIEENERCEEGTIE